MKYIIFGAGQWGQALVRRLGRDKIRCFCDNDPKKVGEKIEGISVISFSKLLEIYKEYILLIAVADRYWICEQLKHCGINRYIIYEGPFDKGAVYKNVVSKKEQNEHDYRINEILDYFSNECASDIPLLDFPEFQDVVRKFLNEFPKDEIAIHRCYGAESILYGHGKALMDYAGIPVDYENFPIVLHYPFSSGVVNGQKSAVIFGNQQDKVTHNDRYPYIPAFTVGNYINYAQPIWTTETIEKKRKVNGNTLLVFLPHSNQYEESLYNNSLVLKHIKEQYVPRYKTVIACVYWCDIFDNVYDELAKYGVKLVSAGFVFDPYFIRRLRTLFDLCDDVAMYGHGSFITYALALKKRYFFHPIKETLLVYHANDIIATIKEERIKKQYEGYDYAMSHPELAHDFDYNYRYGFNMKCSKDDIRTMYEISMDIWNHCNHVVRDYPIGVYRTYQKYQEKDDVQKLIILTESLGQGFYNM